MAKHQCPECGVSHEMSAEGRIKKLEERVAELEAKQHVCPHHYWWWSGTDTTGTTTWSPPPNTTIVYSNGNSEQFTLT